MHFPYSLQLVSLLLAFYISVVHLSQLISQYWSMHYLDFFSFSLIPLFCSKIWSRNPHYIYFIIFRLFFSSLFSNWLLMRKYVEQINNVTPIFRLLFPTQVLEYDTFFIIFWPSDSLSPFFFAFRVLSKRKHTPGILYYF